MAGYGDLERMIYERSQSAKVCLYASVSGTPVCIGKSFAVMESVMILSVIAQRFQVNLVSEQLVEIDPRFTLWPKGGVNVRIEPR